MLMTIVVEAEIVQYQDKYIYKKKRDTYKISNVQL